MSINGSRVLWSLIVLSSFLVLLAVPVGAQETATKVDTWQCLPAETAFAIRIPKGSDFAKPFVENTKLGSVVFSERRKELVSKAITQADAEDWNKLKTQLNEYGLTTDDLLKFLSGETGYAVVLDEGKEGKRIPLGLAWLEPAEDLADRALKIIAMAIEDQADVEYPVVRVDVELADTEVMQLMIPKVEKEYGEEFEYPEGYEDMSDEEREAAWDEAYKKWEASAEETVTYGTLLLAELDGRLLVAHSFNVGEDKDEHPDGERLASLLAQLLEAHATGEGGFVEKYSSDEVVAEVMGIEGVPCLEVVGDSNALIGLATEAAKSKETVEQMRRILGYDSLGMFALKSALSGNLWESRLSVAIGQPREGLMQLVEQESIDLTPPDWIPASAIRCGQLSFDLGKAYETVKEVVTKEFPDQANTFGMLDLQVSGFAQATVQEILESLGKRHVTAYFEPDADAPTGAAGQGFESGAIVWQVTDEQIWSRMLKSIAPLVASAGAKPSDEQGYTGLRVNNENMELGFFLGNGNLVVGVGSGVVETVLSSLNKPPAGEDAFRGSKVYQRATELMDISEGISCDVMDGARYAKAIRKSLLTMLEQLDSSMQMLNGDGDVDQQKQFMELARSLMPTDEEMEDILGVGVSRAKWDDQGVSVSSIQELPPPDEE